MSKETLQHTMRSKVRVFEDGGIRLLRKGQKGLIHAIFSRFGGWCWYCWCCNSGRSSA